MDKVVREFMLENEEIQKLLQVLKLYKLNDKASDVYELTAFIDGLQSKLDEVVDELQNIRKQIDIIQEWNEKKSLKESLNNMVVKLENQVGQMKLQINEIKQNVSDKAKEIVESVKEKGRSGLSKMAELFHVKDNLQKMKNKLESNIYGINQTIGKIDITSQEMSATRVHLSNVFKGIAGKELAEAVERDTSKKSFSNALKTPWLKMKNLQESMIVRIDASIEKVDNLSRNSEMSEIYTMSKEDFDEYVEKAKEAEQFTSGDYQEEIQQFLINSVAEGKIYQSGGEAFDEFNKSMDEKGKLRNDSVQKQSNIIFDKKR